MENSNDNQGKAELFFTCDNCGHYELPSFAFTKLISENKADEKDFPSHCATSMRLTVMEIPWSNKMILDVDLLQDRVTQTMYAFFYKIGFGMELGDYFKEKYSEFLDQFKTETDFVRVHRLMEFLKPALKATVSKLKNRTKENRADFTASTIVQQGIDVGNIVVETMITSAQNRIGSRGIRTDPIMPGSDDSIKVSYFCSVCEKAMEIPEDEKKLLLEDEDDTFVLPKHHDKQVEVRIEVTERKKEGKKEKIPLLHNPTNVDAADHLIVKSVGIDVGTSTTHLIFSELKMKREPGFFNMTNRFIVESRKILYQGKIMTTPLESDDSINIDKVVDFCKLEFQKANITPDEVDTGAVIVTGETAKKNNAADIVNLLATESGKFVSATAGPNFESMLAAMGSGATVRSLDKRKSILSVDIGGGTSNLAISRNGTVISTSCINVGGRLLGVHKSENNKIWRLDNPTKLVLQTLNLNYNIDDHISDEDLNKVCDKFVEILMEVMKGPAKSDLAQALMMTNDLDFSNSIDEIIFCGGVAEYIYDEPNEDYDDIGSIIASKLKNVDFSIPVTEPENKIRATVIGAGSYSLSISGSTCYRDPNLLLPMDNIKVLPVHINKDLVTADYVKKMVLQAFERFDLDEGDPGIALYFRDPIYRSIDLYVPEFIYGLEAALTNSLEKKQPIILLFDTDMASVIGISLKEKTSIKDNLICIDEVKLKEGDWIDIGEPIYEKTVFPLTVKSLVFNSQN